MDIYETYRKSLKERGNRVANLASKILLEDIESNELLKPLHYLLKNRHDILRPSIISLTCEAVGGDPETILPASVAMILECYYLGLIDDVVDESNIRRLSLTLPGKFGGYTTLLISVILKAKAYYALSELSETLNHEKYVEINRVFRDFLVKMIEGEALNFQVKHAKVVDTKKMLQVFELQAADIEACTKIGAIIGNGSETEIDALSKYGLNLGMVLLLKEDLMDTFNFSIRLATKIRRGSYPYPLMWAANTSKEMQDLLSIFTKKRRITPRDIKRCTGLLFDVGAIDHVKNLMGELTNNAVTSLASIRDNEGKKYLKLLAEVQPSLVFKVLTE